METRQMAIIGGNHSDRALEGGTLLSARTFDNDD